MFYVFAEHFELLCWRQNLRSYVQKSEQCPFDKLFVGEPISAPIKGSILEIVDEHQQVSPAREGLVGVQFMDRFDAAFPRMGVILRGARCVTVCAVKLVVTARAVAVAALPRTDFSGKCLFDDLWTILVNTR